MQWIESQALGKPLLHIIDREADSARHLRDWDDSSWYFLVRVNGQNTLNFQGENLKAKVISEQFAHGFYKEIDYQGKRVILKVAETPVILTRKAKPKAINSAGKRVKPVSGKALKLRFIGARLEDKQGNLLCSWYLLSNTNISAEKLTTYYYYRWQIESYFKLLKGAGHHMEDWLEQTGEAFFKRALVAAQSCVMIWHLMRDKSQRAEEFRALLVRLSGRRTKRKKPVTAPALLTGYLILLSAHELLQVMSPEEIAEAVAIFQGDGLV